MKTLEKEATVPAGKKIRQSQYRLLEKFMKENTVPGD